MGEVETIKPLTLLFTIVMGIMTIILPRRMALLPLIIACSYITVGQRIVVFDKDLTIFRIILVFGWIRLFVQKEIKLFKFHAIDKAIVWWVVGSIILGTLLDSRDFVSRLGLAYDTVGLYFLFRFIVRDIDDLETIVKSLAIIIVPLAFTMVIERFTQRNIFSVFGGVPEITMFDGVRMRCQGPFRHPILAGTFGASIMPFYVGLGLLKERATKGIAIVGFTSATIITLASHSSGPIIAYMVGIIGFLIWPLRRRMRVIRWGIASALIALHLFMKDPVWFIIARLSNVFGGTGWHRSYLIDTTIRHFNEWWLVGTKYTAHWFVQVLPINPDMIDITNQYILEGVSGGIIKLFLFILIIVQCFKTVGLSIKTIEDKAFSRKILVWSMGVSLMVHVASYLSVCYFDQMIVFWYLLLAMIAVLPRLTKDISARGNLVADSIPEPTYP